MARDIINNLNWLSYLPRLVRIEKTARWILEQPDDSRHEIAREILKTAAQVRRDHKHGWDTSNFVDTLNQLCGRADAEIFAPYVKESAKRRERFRDQVAEPRNKQARAEGNARRAEWQSAADEIWSRHPEWTASDVARRIAKDRGGDWNTIRRRIARK
ncbi:MAG: hypothetical protein RIB80_18490 [Rhodospirillales bacterium]